MKIPKIGILGGSFDPIHFGHLNLAIEMMEKRHLDEVWFCPANMNPHKMAVQNLSTQHRLQMLSLALEGIPNCRILDVELQRPAPSYTIDTIENLLQNEKGKKEVSQFYLIVGEDAIRGFSRWHRVEELVKLVPLLIGRRFLPEELSSIDNPIIRKAIELGMTETRRMDISSTEIRERLDRGQCCLHLLPEKVMDYIGRHRLYLSLGQ